MSTSTTPTWQAGTLYSPGDLVQPGAVPVYASGQPGNNDFETGDLSSWTPTAGAWTAQLDSYSGSYSAGTTSTGAKLDMTTPQPINAGQTINAACMVKLTNAGTNNGYAHIEIHWQDATHAEISNTGGNALTGSGGYWGFSKATATAPPNAAYVYLRLYANAPTGGQVNFDRVTWDYTYSGTISGLLFEATQPAPAKSGSSEPTWPAVAGNTVVDGGVTWTAVALSRIVWEASPILTSGGAEPTWPTVDGGVVLDNNIDWTAHTKQITDANCPNSKQVLIAASKIYAGNVDIVGHSATSDATDWTSEQDAGFLPFGSNPYGSNDVNALASYRSNLAAFSAEGFQLWQVDPNPDLTDILDSLPIPSDAYRANVPVGNDLKILTPIGVRSLSFAAANDTLEGTDTGMQVDALVKQFSATLDTDVLGLYLPKYGQAWWIYNYGATSNVLVCTTSNGMDMWSRYAFPFRIDDYAIVGTDLYLRSGDDVLVLDDTVYEDYAGSASAAAVAAIIQSPWLDMGQPGIDMTLSGLDIVGDGIPTIEIGYDSSNLARYTDPFVGVANTEPGFPLPMGVTAPSMSVKFSYSGVAWNLQMVMMYVDEELGVP